MHQYTKNSYIQYINTFWKVSKTASFTSTDIALYFYLLDINNSCHWLESFKHNNKAIQAVLNISFKTLSKARENLCRKGLIRFQTQNGSPNVSYQILTYSYTFGEFPKVSNKVRDEINKKEIKINNIKEDVVDFIDYRSYLKSDESLLKKKSIYQLFKLQSGSLEKIFSLFETFQNAKWKIEYSSIEDIHNHFINWLNNQEALGKLNEYKHPLIKKAGSL